MSPTVSVVIPCYNASRFLRETLDSALAQTHAPLEILVIDDGSTDDSADIARSYGPPVRVISQANQGESVARNRGIDEAQGDWIAFLDADDIWHPQKLELQLAAVDSEDVVCVHTNLFFFGDREGETKIEMSNSEARYSAENLARFNVFWSPSAMMVHRRASPYFPTWTRHAEDLIYCLELVTRGRVRLVEKPLAGYRKHAAAQSNSADTKIGWHQSICKWIQSQAAPLGPDSIRVIESHHLTELAGAAWDFKRRRRWKEYWQVREYLRKCELRNEAVEQLLKNRIYPRWVYCLCDSIGIGRKRVSS